MAVTVWPARMHTRLYVDAFPSCKPQHRIDSNTDFFDVAGTARVPGSVSSAHVFGVGTTGLPEDHPGVSEYQHMDGKQRFGQEVFYTFATDE